MNNFIKNLNDNNQIGLMLLYGENGSCIPVDLFYLLATFHTCNKYDLKNHNMLYYDDDVHFVSNDDKIIVINVESCVKLFEKYVSIEREFSLDKVDFDIFEHYEKLALKKYIPYSLYNLNAYYKNGLMQMGENYSLIPVVVKNEEINDEYDCFEDEMVENINQEKYIDAKAVKKLKKKSKY